MQNAMNTNDSKCPNCNGIGHFSDRRDGLTFCSQCGGTGQAPDVSTTQPRDGKDTASGPAPLAIGGAQQQEPSRKVGRRRLIVEGLSGQNEPAHFSGRAGFWCQSDCVFIEAKTPHEAIARYRENVSRASIAISHNHFCDGILRAKEWDGGVLRPSGLTTSGAVEPSSPRARGAGSPDGASR